jgi:hypothetical protein
MTLFAMTTAVPGAVSGSARRMSFGSGGNSLLGTANAGSGILSALSTGLSGRERTRNLLQEGRDLKIQAEIEEFNGRVTENDLRAGLLRLISSNTVATAASGLGGGGPGAEAALAEDFDIMERQARNVRLDTMLKAGALRRGARAARKAGKVSAITNVLDVGAQLAGSFT